MGINRNRAYLIVSSALGQKANFEREELATGETGGTVDAKWIRSLMLGVPLKRCKHKQIAEMYPAYESCVPGDDAPARIGQQGLCIRNARISGTLDLANSGAHDCPLPPLAMLNCRFEGATGQPDTVRHSAVSIDLSYACVTRLELHQSRLSALHAVGLKVSSSVDLSGIRPLNDWRDQAWPGMSHRELARALKRAPDPAQPDAGRPGQEWPKSPLDHCSCNLSLCEIEGHLIVDAVRLRAPRSGGRRHADYSKLTMALNL